jgi:hypothetical protein
MKKTILIFLLCCLLGSCVTVNPVNHYPDTPTKIEKLDKNEKGAIITIAVLVTLFTGFIIGYTIYYENKDQDEYIK